MELMHALRRLFRAWPLTVTIVAVIGVGVGLNAAVLDTLMRLYHRAPAGIRAPEQVQRLTSFESVLDGPQRSRAFFSIPYYMALRAPETDATVAGYQLSRAAVDDGRASAMTVSYVTPEYFDLLGIRPALGRLLGSSDTRFGTPSRVAVISSPLARRRFGRDRRAVGATIRVDSLAYEVIGVAPAGFEGVDLNAVDVWLPISELRPGAEGGDWFAQPGRPVVQLLVRHTERKESVEPRLTAVYRQVASALPWSDGRATVQLAPLLEARGPTGLGRGRERNAALATRLGWLSLTVLLIALSNAASLLLMRAASRRQEHAVRVALGMSARRFAAGIMLEALLIGAAAAAFAILLGANVSLMLRRQLFADINWSATGVIPSVTAVATVLALAIAAVAAISPIAEYRGLGAVAAMRGTTGVRTRVSRLRQALIAGQAILCVVLVGTAGLFVQSLRRLQDATPGYDADHIISVLNAGFRRADADYDALVQRLAGLPFVEAVARSSSDVVPMDRAPIRVPGGDAMHAELSPTFAIVEPAFFRVSGMQSLDGDVPPATPTQQPVAWITETMARTLWPDRSAVGACFFAAASACHPVAGILRDVRWTIASDARPHYFLVVNPGPGVPPMNELFVRTRIPATAEMESQVARLFATSSNGEEVQVRRIAVRLEPQMKPWRLAAVLVLVFGGLALLVAAIGIYGIVSFEVAHRMPELGVRVALGASRRDILRLVLASAVRIGVVASAAGLLVAVLFGRTLSSLLYATRPYDPAALILSVVVVVATAGAASIGPALRATRVNPVSIMRPDA